MRSVAVAALPDRSGGSAVSGSPMPSRSSKSATSSGSASVKAWPRSVRGPARSRPSTPDAERRSRAIDVERDLAVCDSQNVVNTSTPRAGASAASSRVRRLLPIPGGPATPTTAPRPSIALVQQALDGRHLPLSTDQFDSTRAVRSCCADAQQAAGGDRFVGALDLNQLRLTECSPHPPRVARWTR